MTRLPKGIEINNLIDDLRIFSWEASETLLYYSRILKDSNYKSNILKNHDHENPVTLADLKVNEIIIKRINEKYRGINWAILSEENVKIDLNSFYTDHDWVWVLDPLDGTKDFIQGTSNYAMHLALNYKNKPYLGIVLIPEREELWIAYKEKVWCENKNKLKTIPHMLKKKSLQEMIIVTSKNHRNQTLKKLIDKINFKEVLIMGSIGCKITSILQGKSDLYLCLSLPGQSSPKDWDFCAPAVILKSAGGAITNLENKDLVYGKSNFEQSGIVIASNNKDIHESICYQIKEVIKKYDLYPF